MKITAKGNRNVYLHNVYNAVIIYGTFLFMTNINYAFLAIRKICETAF